MIAYLCNDNFLAATQAEARVLDKNFKTHLVPDKKQDLLDYINKLMAPVPADDVSEEMDITPLPVVIRQSYTEQALAFQDEWEKFPLALKLHYAALACEDAREIIKQ
jgi:hypothetical protein